MKEIIVSICSGLIGVLLTIGYQHFLSPPQSFTFIYNGEEMVVTESEYTKIMEENKTLKDEINKTKNQIIDLEEQVGNQQEQLEQQNSREEINKIIQEATEYWNNSEFIQSLTLLKNSKSISTEIESLYKQYSDEYCLNLLGQSDILIADMKNEEAIDLITRYSMFVYDDSILKRKIEEIKNSTPKNLIDSIKPYEKYGYTEKMGGDYMQMGGDKYYNGFQLGTGYETTYAIFNLNSNYKKITGIIGHIDGSGEADKTLIIFADGIIIDTIDIGYQSLPREFSINVEGVNQLKFERTDGSTQTGIANIMIQ